MSKRVILHMDMDAFYASVEIRDNPQLAGKPLIIGALPNERGVVATCSYEARSFGLHSGMSIKEAYRLCPHGIYMHGNSAKYHAVSQQVHQILMDYTDQIEFVALDEGYLDITGSLSLFGSAEKIGREIKQRILTTTGLTCSIGIGYNKMTAKIASEEKKPDGFFVIPDPQFFQDLIIDRPIRVLPGIGRKTAQHLTHYQLHTVRDLLNWSAEALQKLLGQHGLELYQSARGLDERPVLHLGEGEMKSYGKEVTYQHDMTDLLEMESTLRLLSRTLSIGLMRDKLWCHTVTLKIKYNNLQLHTRSKTLINPIHDAHEIYETARALLRKDALPRPVRLLGISTSSFTAQPVRQLTLEDAAQNEKRDRLNQTLLHLYDKFGKDIIQTGGELESQKLLKERDLD
ncbi:MAG: DNA polymerase IV [Lachnospiraceae bacterium]|nr:DNA polymerase IV [Lachnospiraceae bacterium]